MEIKQNNRSIKHLDHYVRDMLNEYKGYIEKSLRPKRVPISPGVILRLEDSPTLPDPSKQKFYGSFLPCFSLWRRGFAAISLLQYHSWLDSVLRHAAPGATPWAAFHHLMEYVEGLPSFKITYHHRIKHYQDLLSGYADLD